VNAARLERPAARQQMRKYARAAVR